jgi:hypothetical protein
MRADDACIERLCVLDDHLAQSLDRHTVWAREFAAVGDFESALQALWDIHAVAGELTDNIIARA